MAKMGPIFQKKFEAYLEGCQSVFDDYLERNGYQNQRVELTYKVGRRYVKVFQGSSVHSFVDMKKEEGLLGNVYKPASCSAPAKHARGNIYREDNGLTGMGPHGPAYLR